jgi:NHL repeat
MESWKGSAWGRGFARTIGLAALGIALTLLIGGSSASAAESPPLLWGGQPGEACDSGVGAGQCRIPRGVAANPDNGHVFVSDQLNERIVEFNAAGQFIKAWGWDVVESGPGDDTVAPEDQFEICIPARGDVCKAGLSGPGAGQLNEAQGVALDSSGDIYVVDWFNLRVQKFDSEGNFLLMFGDGVDQGPTHPGDVCTAQFVAEGDTCGAGTEGSAGEGQFLWPTVGSFLAITPADKVYVGDRDRIQRFDTEGVFQDEIALAGKTVKALASDSAGNLYYADNGQPGVHKIGPSGTPLAPETFELPQFGFSKPSPSAVAVDAAGDVFAFTPPVVESKEIDPIVEFEADGTLAVEFGKGEFTGSTGLATNLCAGSEAPGNLYATNASEGGASLRAYGTDPIGCFKARTEEADPVGKTSATLNGTVNPSGLEVSECFFEWGTSTTYGEVAECEPDAGELGEGSTPVPVQAELGELEAGTVYHFALVAKIGGETEAGADQSFKTLGPPVISEDHTVATTDTEATLRALVNPEGFPTSCHFDYGTSSSYGQSTPTQSFGEDRSEHSAQANLTGLSPGTTYHWRIVCANSSPGSAEGEDHIAITFNPSGADTGCPNQAFRTEASASLPDCRAYEMVSPVDKNGGDIVKDLTSAGEPGGYTQATADGDALTYTAYAAFPGAPNSFRFNQYLAARHERGTAGEGWSNEGINVPIAGQEVAPLRDTFGFLRYFMAFSPDLCNGWLIDFQTPAPTGDGQAGLPNLYRREGCGATAGGLEALVPSPQYEVPGGTLGNYVDRNSVQGYSADSRHAILVAAAKLTPEAATGDSAQVYDSFGGALHLVSVLPNGSANPGESEVGSGPRAGNVERAVSEDGSRVYWTGGKLYVRIHPEQGIVEEECSTPDVACTIAVSAGGGFFWAAAKDGSKALYTEGGNLFEFDLGEEASQLIAGGVKGVAGTSEDLGRIYFVSTEALNEEAEGEEAGRPNLYLAEGGTTRFVAELSEKDVGEKESGASVLAYDLAGTSWYRRATRVSADGERIAFQSRARLSGYDNRGPDGRAAVEVFTYQASTGDLACVSCNPSRGRPSGVGELREPYASPWAPVFATKVPAAAWLPTWEQPLHASNLLSAAGDRLFFNSFDALLPRDTNGAQDVYEWETAGTGGCEVGDANYFADNGGCLYLISSGESPYESEFWEASRDGRDVFFTTESSLLPQDPGSIDLYDARIGGGFPQPEGKAACEGEACQSPPAPPGFPDPSSSSYSGPANPAHGTKPRCPKGKHRVRKAGKSRCVEKSHKNKSQKNSRRGADHNRRAAR